MPWQLYIKGWIRKFGIKTRGQIVQLDVKTITGKYGRRTMKYSVSYTFLDCQGKIWRGQQHISSRTYSNWRKGDVVTIAYLKSNPNQNFIIYNFASNQL